MALLELGSNLTNRMVIPDGCSRCSQTISQYAVRPHLMRDMNLVIAPLPPDIRPSRIRHFIVCRLLNRAARNVIRLYDQGERF